MSTNDNILIVEDEADLADLLRYNLEREGYVCQCVADGERGLSAARRDPPDLMILDRMLPKMSGDHVIADLRRDPKTASIRVLMLTAKAEESDELVGFALGVDDYITKPFSMKRLLARVDALLRRTAAASAQTKVLSVGPLTLDRDRRELTVHDKPAVLTTTEFEILWELMAARERVLTRDQLINAVLGDTAIVTDRTIDVHVAALRKKLGGASSLIQTVRGVGYTLRRSREEDA